MARFGGIYVFETGSEVIRPFVSGDLGLASIRVESYRQRNVGQIDGPVEVREHLATTSVSLIPAAGVRFLVAPGLETDLAVENQAFFGSASGVGGLGISLGAAFRF